MERFAHSILRRRKIILSLFGVALIISAFLATKVEINYDLSSYVPDAAASTLGIDTVRAEFKDYIPNLDIMVPGLDIAQALSLKGKLAQIPEIKLIRWLDDVADISLPIEVMNQESRDYFYKDATALFQVSLKSKDYNKSIKEIRATIGQACALRGQAIDLARASNSVTEEVQKILLFAVPAAFLILVLATTSWFEPLLFMLAIFVGVLLNLGSNIWLKEVSFITQSVGAVLQLAVSMDYAVFLLNRFGEYRQQGLEVEEALSKAIVKAFSSITASALTTFFGFLALVFMRFKLGPNLGIVLAKGIIFSLISVLFFLPTLLMFTYKIVERSSHRSFLPSFTALGRGVVKAGPLILVLVLIISAPLFLAQRKNQFLYGMGDYPQDSFEHREREQIKAAFGELKQLVLLVPAGDTALEEQLAIALKQEPSVRSVLCYSTMVGNQIPPEILPAQDLQKLRNERFSRFIISSNVPQEGASTFQTAADLRAIAQQFYGTKALWAGESFVLSDMRETIQADNIIVNGLAILSVALVLLFTFRSLTLPLILVFTIELSIWCNLAIPYFTGTMLNYIGYLVISTIQLGATVDYAILSTQNYLNLRAHLSPKEAAALAVQQSAPAIIPPALILSSAGFVLAAVSTITVVSEIGLVLGRGAALSLLSVLFILPNLLRLFDPLIRKTTLGLNILKTGAAPAQDAP